MSNQSDNNYIYWKKRAEQRLIDAEKKALRLEKDLKKQFEKTYKNIQAKISELYFKYGKESGLEYEDVVKYLNQNERKEFQKDLNFYIEAAKSGSYEKSYQLYLLALSTRSRISRLQALELSIRYEANELYNNYLRLNTQITLYDILNETYYKTIFDIQQFKGFGTNFSRLSPNLIESLLEYPWSGKNYSHKIWGNVNNFSSKLEDTLTAGIIQGKSNQDMAKELRKATDVAYKNVVRLIRTETNYIAGEATFKAYEAMDIEKYQFLATLDIKTSTICRELDKKMFLVSERKVGINANPMHPHCRSTTIPYIEDLEGTRIARNTSKNKSYYVDRNMTYQEWYKKHVITDTDEMLAEKMHKNKSADKKQQEKYREVLGNKIPKDFEKFRQIKYNNPEKWVEIKKEYTRKRKDE